MLGRSRGQGILRTERLVLRAFRPQDASRFQSLAGEWAVARMTSDIPHPLSPEQARAWLLPAPGEARFAIERDGAMIGGAGYFRRASGAAEIGFWLGHPYWGQGYATEAVKAVIAHGLAQGQQAFSSSHFIDNPASARVLVKVGFEPAGSGTIWCTARGGEVAARYYWLSRARAAAEIKLPAAAQGRWSALLDRVRGG